MPSDSIMNIQPGYRRLLLATEAGRMTGLVEKELRRLRGNSVNIRKLLVTRVFPRRQRRFAIQYEIFFGNDGQGGDGKIYFCGILQGSEDERPRYADPDNKNVIIFQDIGLVIPIFPFDPRLRYLADMMMAIRTDSLNEIIGDHRILKAAGLRMAGYEILGYRLERRCVIRYSLMKSSGHSGQPDRKDFIAKVFRPGRALEPSGKLQWLQGHGFGRDSADRLTVPEIYHCDDQRGITIMENAPGQSLHDLLSESCFDKACAAAAGFLRKLHSSKAPGAEPYSVANELETLGEKIELCGDIFPAIRGALRRIYESLSCEKDGVDEDIRTAIHGDFHDKQVLYAPERSTLLDCDNMKLSDPALDYGNFLAHLLLRRIQSPELAGNIEKGMKAFAGAYNEKSQEFENRASWWLAAALLRLVVIYSLRPRWRGHIPELVQMTDRVLNKRHDKCGGVDGIFAD